LPATQLAPTQIARTNLKNKSGGRDGEDRSGLTLSIEELTPSTPRPRKDYDKGHDKDDAGKDDIATAA